MKIRCDVCDKVEATVFCCADEAALCDGCDHRVHHANMLASKHSRFSLVHPSFKESPLCDICQVRRAVLFCQEDRAILCRECDLPIHKHPPPPATVTRTLALPAIETISHTLKKPSSASNEIFSSSSVETASPPAAFSYVDNHVSGDGSISTSSISEYLETVPGWNVDDFLDPSFSGNNSVGKGWNASQFLKRVPLVFF
ncbi:hypothetical protein OIU76_015452 [Salix suchowensis]|nr:hypothetical protein OIU76_015452 [Salix suchowensis]